MLIRQAFLVGLLGTAVAIVIMVSTSALLAGSSVYSGLYVTPAEGAGFGALVLSVPIAGLLGLLTWAAGFRGRRETAKRLGRGILVGAVVGLLAGPVSCVGAAALAESTPPRDSPFSQSTWREMNRMVDQLALLPGGEIADTYQRIEGHSLFDGSILVGRMARLPDDASYLEMPAFYLKALAPTNWRLCSEEVHVYPEMVFVDDGQYLRVEIEPGMVILELFRLRADQASLPCPEL